MAVLTLADAEAQLEARSYQGSWLSQAGQDRWAALYALRGTPPPEENEKARSAWPQRWFVEVGAADGIELSNSAALERLGWRGVCIEASPSSVARLRTNRPGCITVDAVVGRTAGEKVTFTSYEVVSAAPPRSSLGRLGVAPAPCFASHASPAPPGAADGAAAGRWRAASH